MESDSANLTLEFFHALASITDRSCSGWSPQNVSDRRPQVIRRKNNVPKMIQEQFRLFIKLTQLSKV
jgi:hypothetical protein